MNELKNIREEKKDTPSKKIKLTINCHTFLPFSFSSLFPLYQADNHHASHRHIHQT